MTSRAASTLLARLLARLLAGSLIGGGAMACSAGGPPATSPEASVSPAVRVRTDREPVAKVFPALRKFERAHWIGTTEGVNDSRVPGPTDYRVEAVVRMRDHDMRLIKRAYEWSAVSSPRVSRELASARPSTSAAWSGSEEFTREFLRTASSDFSGQVYAQFATGTLYFEVGTH